MERQNDDNPNPRCPSPALAAWLRIPENILSLPRVLMQYSLRLPVIPGDDRLMAWIRDPRVRLNLIAYLRNERLIHPLIMIREAIKREPYLRNDDLCQWILSSLRGQMTPNIADNPLKTNRCSFCGSSFFGFPMCDHSIGKCKLFLLIPREHHLDFVVANTLSFCGNCNSRSVRHEDCPQAAACTTCGKLGHKDYHGVCTGREDGPTIEQFHALVRELRIRRAQRIRWMVKEGLLGIPFPTDFVSWAVLDQLDIAESRRKILIGAGPLKRPEAELYGDIPDEAYRWKSYEGLYSVELHPLRSFPCVQFTDESADWFQILECRARAAYTNRNPERDYAYILDHTYNIPRPIFPDNIYAPGRDRIVNGRIVLASNIPLQDIGLAPRQEAQEVVLPENDGRVARREERPGSPESSDNGSNESSDNIAIEEREPASAPLTVWERLNPPAIQLTIKERFDRLIENSSFIEKVDRLFLGENLDEPSSALSTKEKEIKLKELVQKEIEQYSVLVNDKRYGIGINRSVVDKVSSIGFPSDTWDIALRIQTWQLILTGSEDRSAMSSGPEDQVKDYYWKYARYLMDTALALVDHPRFLTKLTCERTAVSSHIVKGIPTIENFCFPEVRDSMMAWTAAERHHFSSFSLSKDSYAIQIATPRRGDQEKTKNEELLEGQIFHMFVESSSTSQHSRLSPIG